jgi:hypothetical protein
VAELTRRLEHWSVAAAPAAHPEADARMRAAVARFNQLVEQAEALRSELQQRVQERPGGLRRVFGRLRGGAPDPDEGEYAATVDRRLRSLKEDAAAEQDRAELAAAKAAVADLEQKLADARRRLNSA